MKRYFKGPSLVCITHFHLERIKQIEVKSAHNMNLRKKFQHVLFYTFTFLNYWGLGRKKGFSPSVQCGEKMVGRDI